jgi:hypothetical protein
MRKLNLAVPTPCTESWDAMAVGSESRFCESCGKAVHDLSQMTQQEVYKLVRSSPGGLCGRVTKDNRGEILYRREAEGNGLGRLVGISLLGASALAAQTQGDGASCKLEVRVSDITGAVVPNATVRVARDRNWQEGRKASTDAQGMASYTLPAGEYNVRVESPGFANSELLEMRCEAAKEARADVQLRVGVVIGEVVLVGKAPLLDVRPLFRRLRNLF